MSKGNGKGGRIITGPGDSDDMESGGSEIPIPPMNTYWVKWFNPEIERVETVHLSAHTVEIYDDGMLVFKGFVRNDEPAMLAAGAPPVYGYYVGSFRNHIRFGQDIPQQQGQVH